MAYQKNFGFIFSLTPKSVENRNLKFNLQTLAVMRARFAIILIICSLTLFGKEVPVEKAKTVATNFLLSTSTLKGISQFELTYVPFSTIRPIIKGQKKSAAKETLIHLFEINDNAGFIIVSGDDLATPVLGYSMGTGLDPSRVPDNFRKWIEGYKKQIRYVQSRSTQASSEIAEHWDKLLSGKLDAKTKSTNAVDPLLVTKWNQSPFVNDLCPYDNVEGDRAVTGCAATAMAQIMKFWNHPKKGSGFHSYDHELYGTLSANFGGTTYDWASMSDEVMQANEAIATLMFHCGVSINMDYGVSSQGGSGAYVISSHSPIDHCVEYSLKTYFNYDQTVQGVERSEYTTSAWIDLLKTELNAGRPIEYAGFGLGGGHAFVCDGYDINDFFHFNWGWGGYYDGYFTVDALNPGGTGIGGGTGSYNSGQQAIIGIQPADLDSDFDLQLYEAVTISENPLYFLDSFNIHSDIANFGEMTFTGDFCAAVFDMDHNFIDYARIVDGASLTGGKHYTYGLDFWNSGAYLMLPGDYNASIFYRETNGNWVIVEEGAYTNYLEFNVYYDADIELYTDFSINPGTTITQNEPMTVTADIFNNGQTRFVGELEVALYDLDGEFAAIVENLKGADLDPNYFYESVEFTSSGITVDPGTYLMALLHKPDGGEWTLSGSTFFTNPIKVILKEAPLSQDIYEDNGEPDLAYYLVSDFSQDVAQILTEGSNNHVGTDLDYYYIYLEEGYDYTLSTRVHDSYNSGNQKKYSNDVVWAYYQYVTEEWSPMYDDEMPDTFTIPNGGYVYFVVTPFFEGETGTYLLDIEINRTENVFSGTKDESYLELFPNPTNRLLQIESSEIIEHIEFLDINGRVLLSVDAQGQSTSLDLTNFAEGTYFIQITQQDKTSIRKITKQ